MTAYSIGEVYFMVWYADDDERFPYIDTLVFIGINLEGSDQRGDAWYFQDTESYCRLGGYPGNRDGDGKRDRLYVLRREDLHQVVNAEGLINEISTWVSRQQMKEVK